MFETTHQGCYSFCLPNCRFCTVSYPCRPGPYRYDLLPPNEGADTIHDLRFGHGDYDEAKAKFYRELNAWVKGGEQGPKPQHWRKAVRDHWAGIPIYEDPDTPPNLSYQRDKMYDPGYLNYLLLESPRIIRVTQHAIQEEGTMMVMRRVQAELLTFYQKEYHPRWQVEQGEAATPERWRRCKYLLEQATDIISQWLLLNYERHPEIWAIRVMHFIPFSEVSEKWRGYMERVNQWNGHTFPTRIKKDRGGVVSTGNQELSHVRNQPTSTDPPTVAGTPVPQPTYTPSDGGITRIRKQR